MKGGFSDQGQERHQPRRGSAVGQFERFTPSELSDRNGFVNETFAGMGVTDGSAPFADRAAGLRRPRRWELRLGLVWEPWGPARRAP